MGTTATRTSPYEQNAETARSTPPAAAEMSPSRSRRAGGDDHECSTPRGDSHVERVRAGCQPDRGGRDHEERSRSTRHLLAGDVSGCEEHRGYCERATDHEHRGGPICAAETRCCGAPRAERPFPAGAPGREPGTRGCCRRTRSGRLRDRAPAGPPRGTRASRAPVKRCDPRHARRRARPTRAPTRTAEPKSSCGHRSDIATRGPYTTASPPISTTNTAFVVTLGSKPACSGGTSMLMR